jgi:hypothetical protein
MATSTSCRAVRLAVTVALLTLVASGCGGGTKTNAARTGATQTTSATTGAIKPNGLEKKPPAQVAQAAAAALKAAKSVHITWTWRSEGKAMRVETRVRGGSYAGIYEEGDARFEVIGIGNDTYFRANERGYKLAGVPGLLGRLAAGQWTKSPSKEANWEEQFSLATFADLLPAGNPPFEPTVEQATLDGDKVVVVAAQDGSKLHVANTGPAYPRRFDSNGADLARIDFTEYGVDFHITAPS